MDRKSPKFSEYLRNSTNLYKNNDLKDVFNYIKTVIPYENYFEFWFISCEIYLSLKKFKEADEAISNAIHINSNSAKAWYLKAKSLIGLMDYENALKSTNNALSIEFKSEYLELNQNILKFLNINLKDSTYNNFFNFNYTNKEDNIVTLVNDNNIQIFSQKKLTSSIYYSILNKVIDNVLYKINIGQEDIYSKIINFAAELVNLNYKHDGESHGTYIFNTVEIDERLLVSQQIAALIHEIAHHLLSEIFEQCLMYIFNSVKTDTIEAFAWYAISQKPEYILMNEYCAHTVECYFMPYSGNNYESFNKVLNENFNLNDFQDIKKINKATKIGNTFAQDIIFMLNKFFTEDLKNEIKIQYAKDRLYYSRHLGTEFLTKEAFNEQYKLTLINNILKEAFIDIKLNFSYAQLFQFKESFRRENMNLFKLGL